MYLLSLNVLFQIEDILDEFFVDMYEKCEI